MDGSRGGEGGVMFDLVRLYYNLSRVGHVAASTSNLTDCLSGDIPATYPIPLDRERERERDDELESMTSWLYQLDLSSLDIDDIEH
jgi:hypothetical protein